MCVTSSNSIDHRLETASYFSIRWSHTRINTHSLIFTNACTLAIVCCCILTDNNYCLVLYPCSWCLLIILSVVLPLCLDAMSASDSCSLDMFPSGANRRRLELTAW